MASPQDIIQVAFIGIGATAFMDMWLKLLQRLGVPTLNFALIGRWAGHLLRGKFRHTLIGRAPPIPGEAALGWLVHYAVGMAFAGLLVVGQGLAWMAAPSMLPALVLGICTVIVPLGVMQPAMGLGFASSKTPTPFRNCLRSVVNHGVFGLGLYLSAAGIAWIRQ
ncbi:MAG TPA: DUF2938 domain-containing protein [Burkholderiaceae bacterium]